MNINRHTHKENKFKILLLVSLNNSRIKRNKKGCLKKNVKYGPLVKIKIDLNYKGVTH